MVHSSYILNIRIFLNSFHRTSMFVDIEFVSRKIVHKADANSFIDIILALGHRYSYCVICWF